MKRILVTTAAMIFAVGLLAAEDGLSLSGGVYTGAKATFDDSGNKIELYNSAKQKASRIDLNVDYTVENVGASIRLRAQGLELSSVAFTGSAGFYYAYGFANLFNNMFTVKAGIVDDGSWTTLGDMGMDFVCENPGMQLQIKPIAGLNFGTFITTPTESASISKDIVSFGASYALENTFSIQAGYALSGNAYAGFSIDAVKGLTVIGEGTFLTLYGTPAYTLSETLGYAFTQSFSADCLLYQYLTDNYYSFEPAVHYMVNDTVKTSLAGGYTLYTTEGTTNAWYVKPYVDFVLGKGASTTVYYKAISDASYHNVVGIDFAWKF